LTKEVDMFSQGLRSLGEEMVQAQSSVQKMHQTLEAVASGDLTENAKKLGSGMETLGTEMDKAGDAVVRMRSDLVDMATRFQSFNTGSSSSDAKPSA
jgi:DNA anti-recombination protein RmuC